MFWSMCCHEEEWKVLFLRWRGNPIFVHKDHCWVPFQTIVDQLWVMQSDSMIKSAMLSEIDQFVKDSTMHNILVIDLLTFFKALKNYKSLFGSSERSQRKRLFLTLKSSHRLGLSSERWGSFSIKSSICLSSSNWFIRSWASIQQSGMNSLFFKRTIDDFNKIIKDFWRQPSIFKGQCTI